MRDFDMIVRHFPERQDIHLHFIADVHLGAREHLTAEWEDFCGKVLDDPNSYIIIGGDLINNATRNSVSNVFDETMRPREQKRVMTEMLKPLANESCALCRGIMKGEAAKTLMMTRCTILCANWI